MPVQRMAGLRTAIEHRQHSTVPWAGLDRFDTGRAQGCMAPCGALRRTVSLSSPATRLAALSARRRQFGQRFFCNLESAAIAK